MVRLTIQVRPQRGYTYPGAVRKVTVDSSLRLEQLLSDLKLSKKGTMLYSFSGLELPLNSSLASHNVQDGDILETCSSPLLSAILSAVISDLEAVQQQLLLEEDRTRERIKPLLDNVDLEGSDWTRARWSFDDVKRRGICLKMMKQVLQRNGRFANLQVPQCNDLHSLHEYMRNAVFNTPGHHTMQQCFKPSSRNRDGKPSICWELLQHKLNKFLQLAAENHDVATSSGGVDLIEAFVKAENDRQRALKGESATGHALGDGGTPTAATIPSRRRAEQVVNRPVRPRRPQRRLPDPTADSQQQHHQVQCLTCTTAPAECTCLDASCPFEKQPCCFRCFVVNHPVLVREHHERVPLDDARAKAVLKQGNGGRKSYCPEYASGPFAILSTLYEAMQQNIYGNRQLSLTEKRLKELAQPRCRANLYDRQARGRSAFACIEKLTSDGLVRKEIIPGEPEESARYSLLPSGERLAKFCLAFETAFKSVVQNPNMIRDRNAALGGADANESKVSIVVDNREDKTFAERLTNRCEANGVDYIRRDLPAGDYLFTTKIRKDGSEMVLPLVIERKTWSDLADSVTGKGHRRLDCVKLGSQTGICDLRHCQLCRMKRSQCPKIMFIIEGARCQSRDGQETKCSASSKRCKYCRELQERHGPNLTQEALEQVIYRLQVEHNCLIHCTRDYNETIMSLFLLREILGSGIQDGVSDPDDEMANALALSRAEVGLSSASTISLQLEQTYQQFCSNARRSGDDENSHRVPPRGEVVEWKDEEFIRNVHGGKVGESLSQIFPSTADNSSSTEAAANVVDLSESFSAERTAGPIESDDEEDMQESQGSIQVFENGEWASAKPKAALKSTSNAIDVDAEEEEEGFPESQDSVQVLELLGQATPRKLRIDETGKSNESAATQMRTAGPASGANGAISSKIDSSRTPLFLLIGLYEYDQGFHSDANKLWKQLYENRNQATDFGSLAKQQLRQLQGSGTPFVERDAILFCILFLQLRYDVIFHAARQSSCESELRTRWGGQSQEPVDGIGPASTRDHISSVGATRPASERPSCVICNEKLGRSNVQSLPCAHSFHSNCLAQWFAMKQTRLCPVCKYPADDGTAQPRSPIASATSRVGIPHSTATRTASHSVAMVREARLRHFGLPPAGPTVASRAAAVARGHEANRSWVCHKCTYENNAGSSICQMCQAPPSHQIERASRNGPGNGLAGVGSRRWTCSDCTLENDMHVNCCDACGSRNPFRADQEQVSSHATPTAYVRPAKADSTPRTAGKAVKCGGCGRTGHNRGSATPGNCPEYHSESEVKLRRKKKEDAERKRREASQRIEQLQQEEGNFNERMRTAELALTELRQTQASRVNMTQHELRRLNKEKERAEKRARKFR